VAAAVAGTDDDDDCALLGRAARIDNAIIQHSKRVCTDISGVRPNANYTARSRSKPAYLAV
jgi:hypothetical protein